MKIMCRAKLSKSCQDGAECVSVYGEDDMGDDGTFDGTTVVCTPCYIAGGQPSIPYPASRTAVVEHINREMGLGGGEPMREPDLGNYYRMKDK